MAFSLVATGSNNYHTRNLNSGNTIRIYTLIDSGTPAGGDWDDVITTVNAETGLSASLNDAGWIRNYNFTNSTGAHVLINIAGTLHDTRPGVNRINMNVSAGTNIFYMQPFGILENATDRANASRIMKVPSNGGTLTGTGTECDVLFGTVENNIPAGWTEIRYNNNPSLGTGWTGAGLRPADYVYGNINATTSNAFPYFCMYGLSEGTIRTPTEIDFPFYQIISTAGSNTNDQRHSARFDINSLGYGDTQANMAFFNQSPNGNSAGWYSHWFPNENTQVSICIGS